MSRECMKTGGASPTTPNRVLSVVGLWLGCFVVLAILIGVLTVTWWQYAPGYTDAKFGSISKGMTRAQVTAILGSPLEESRVKLRQYTVSTQNGRPRSVVVAYDPDGSVSLDSPRDPVAERRNIQVGTTRADAESALHTTSSILKSYVEYLHYSRNRGLGWGDHSRKIGFDGGGRVVKIVREDWEW